MDYHSCHGKVELHTCHKRLHHDMVKWIKKLSRENTTTVMGRLHFEWFCRMDYAAFTGKKEAYHGRAAV
jgi:hypothetical protein